MLEFFKKLFGLSEKEDYDQDFDLSSKYDIVVENIQELGIGQQSSKKYDYDNDGSQQMIVDCSVNGEKTKYFVFENYIFNYETMLEPTDEYFAPELSEAIWLFKEKQEHEEKTKVYIEIMKKYKEDLVKALVPTLDPVVEEATIVEENTVEQKDNIVTKRIVSKAIKKEQETIQEEKNKVIEQTPKKKGGRPKKDSK